MALYKYKAVNAAGDVAAGELEAANESEIVDRLRDQGLMPMHVEASAGMRAAAGAPSGVRTRWFTPKHVTRDHLLALTRELATLLRAGLPLDRALEMLISLAPTPPVALLLQTVRDDVRGGKSLSQALDTHRERVLALLRQHRARRRGGRCARRRAHAARRHDGAQQGAAREREVGADLPDHPVIGVAVTSVMVLLIFVVPQFQQTFAQAGKALPLPTQIVIIVGTALRKYWWLMILIVVAAVWIVRRRLNDAAVRFRWDGRLLRMPLVGDLVAKVEVARFARTLATLLANGVTLLAGLAIVKDTMSNSVLAQALDGVITRLREGKGFGRPLAETGLYPRLATQMILVGEESGRLEEMLNRVADVYDREVQMAIKRFLAVLEPVLILGLAVLIGGIVLLDPARRHGHERTCRLSAGSKPIARIRKQRRPCKAFVTQYGRRGAPRARGMTLIEILVVLVLIGIVMGIVGGNFIGQGEKAKRKAAKIEIEQIGQTLDLYKLEVGRYPTTQEGLQALITAPAGVANWNGPYWKKATVPKDPWGNEYKYVLPGQHGAYDIVSLRRRRQGRRRRPRQGHQQLGVMLQRGASARARGVTLLELLIVLVDHGLRGRDRDPDLRRRRVDHRAQGARRARSPSGLRYARGQAIAQRGESLLVLDVDARTFTRPAGRHACTGCPTSIEHQALHRAARPRQRKSRRDPLLPRWRVERRAHHARGRRAQVRRRRRLAHRSRGDPRLILRRDHCFGADVRACARDVPSRAGGFSLIEVLAAFVILALVGTALFRLFSGALGNASLADEYGRATLYAESRLAALGVETPLREGSFQGTSEDGTYTWSATIAPFSPPGTTPDMDGTAAAMAVRLWRLAVTVRWPGATPGSERTHLARQRARRDQRANP